MRTKMKGLYFGVMMCLAMSNLTGCGDGEADGNTVTGRLTAISDTSITMEVFPQMEEGKERPVSGGAIGKRPDGQMPEGTPPAGMEMPEGEMPEGTPPADREMSEGEIPEGEEKNGSNRKQGGRNLESKTYEISEDVQVYKQQGEETVEITWEEVELGTLVSVVEQDGVISAITVQEKTRGNFPSGFSKKEQAK